MWWCSGLRRLLYMGMIVGRRSVHVRSRRTNQELLDGIHGAAWKKQHGKNTNECVLEADLAASQAQFEYDFVQ